MDGENVAMSWTMLLATLKATFKHLRMLADIEVAFCTRALEYDQLSSAAGVVSLARSRRHHWSKAAPGQVMPTKQPHHRPAATTHDLDLNRQRH